MKAALTCLALAHMLAACSHSRTKPELDAWKLTERTFVRINLAHWGTQGDQMSAAVVTQGVRQRYPEVPIVNGKIVDAWGHPIRITITRAALDAWGKPVRPSTPRVYHGINTHLRSAGPDGIEYTADDVTDESQSYERGPCPPMPASAR